MASYEGTRSGPDPGKTPAEPERAVPLVLAETEPDQGAARRVLTSLPEILALAELGREQALRVQDWAEIRRLRRAEDMPIAEIAQVTGSPEHGGGGAGQR